MIRNLSPWRRAHLCLERLEERTLLSTIPVIDPDAADYNPTAHQPVFAKAAPIMLAADGSATQSGVLIAPAPGMDAAGDFDLYQVTAAGEKPEEAGESGGSWEIVMHGQAPALALEYALSSRRREKSATVWSGNSEGLQHADSPLR